MKFSFENGKCQPSVYVASTCVKCSCQLVCEIVNLCFYVIWIIL